MYCFTKKWNCRDKYESAFEYDGLVTSPALKNNTLEFAQRLHDEEAVEEQGSLGLGLFLVVKFLSVIIL